MLPFSLLASHLHYIKHNYLGASTIPWFLNLTELNRLLLYMKILVQDILESDDIYRTFTMNGLNFLAENHFVKNSNL